MNLARGLARPIARPIAGGLTSGEGGGVLGTAIQRHLDNGETYDATQYNGKFILKNLAPTGQSYSATVDVPCWTGAGAAYIDLGATPQLPAGDWEVEFLVYLNDVATQYVPFSQWNVTQKGLIVLHAPINGWRLNYANVTANEGAVTALANTWYRVKVTHAGTTTTLFVDDVQKAQRTGAGDIASTQGTLLGAYGNADPYNENITNPLAGRLSDVKITVGGVVKYFPLQEGVGTGAANRNVYSCSSDGTGAIYQDAVKAGTVSAIWANVMPGTVKDWSILYGSGLGMYGESIPGLIGAATDAEGTTKRWAAGKLSNRYSVVNFNPNAEAELTAISAETEYSIFGDRAFTATTDTKFARLADSSVDRMVSFAAALTGADLATIQAYCPASWKLRLSSFNVYGGHPLAQGFSDGSGNQYVAIRKQIRRYRPDAMVCTEVKATTYLDQVNNEHGFLQDVFSSGGEGTYFQSLHSRFTILSSEIVPSGVGGAEFARPVIFAEIDFGHPTKTLGVYGIHAETGGCEGLLASEPDREQNDFRRAVEWYRIADHIATQRAANADLLIVVMGDWNDDPSLAQFATVTSAATDGGSGIWAGFSKAASTPSSFPYQFYPTDQVTAVDLAIVPATNLDANPVTMWTVDPNSLIVGEAVIDYITVDDAFTIIAGELVDSEATQTGGIAKYGSALDSTVSRDASDHKMIVADVLIA